MESKRDSVDKTVHLWDDQVGYRHFEFRPYAYKKDEFGGFTTIYGDQVGKIENWSKWDEDDGNLFESDVPIETRILVDLYHESDDPSTGHSVLTFDIEVDTEEGLPNMDQADKEITSVSFHDSVADEYYVLILDKNNEVKQTTRDNEYIIPFNTEADLLNAFVLKWQEIKPSIITGWNIDGFDIPYMYRRMVKIIGQHRANGLSPINKVYFSKWKQRFYIAGVSSLDYLPLYKKFRKMAGEPDLPSFSLDSVGKAELSKGKVEYDGSLHRLMLEDIDKFIEYNLVDTKLVVELEVKQHLIEAVQGICHKGHVGYEQIFMSSRWIEGAILTYCKKHNLIAPNKDPRNKDKMNKEQDKYAGGYVKVPESSKHEWIYDLDLTSQYPSIIISINISPETKVGKIDGWNAEQYINDKSLAYSANIMGQESEIFGNELEEILHKHHFSIASNGVIYRTDKKGLIPQILSEWSKDKTEYDRLMKRYGKEGDKEKERYYKQRRTIAKVMLNSVYGALGLPVFRFYDVDNAEAVTLTGQALIKFTESMANHYYGQITGEEKDYCLYIDTDSIFMPAIPLIEKIFPNTNLDNNEEMSRNILQVTTKVQDFLNQTFDLFADQFLNLKVHSFDIKQEVIARAGLWTVKKRYALWIINDSGVPKDEVMYKGLDVVRSSFPESFRVFLKDILNNILKKDTNDDNTRKEINAKVVDFQQKIQTIALDQIANSVGVRGLKKYGLPKAKTIYSKLGNWIKGSPVHVKAVLSYNELLKMWNLEKHFMPIQESEKIKWVYLKENDLGVDALAFRGFEDPPEILDFLNKYLDREKMLERSLEGKLLDVYEALKWQVPNKQQEKVEKWFGV